MLIGTQKAPSGTPVPELQVILVSRWQVRMSCIHLCFTYKCWQCGVFCTRDPPVGLWCVRYSDPTPIGTQTGRNGTSVPEM